MSSLFERVTSSTPHTPEAPYVGGLFGIVAVVAYAFAYHQHVTIRELSSSIQDILLGMAGGALASGGQRRIQGDKTTPEPVSPVPPVPPA